MEQSEPSKQNTETDLQAVEERQKHLYKIASDAYYRKPEMVRFVLIENLALKSLLLEKGMITLEEFQKAREFAKNTLDIEVRRQLDEWRRNNPKENVLFEILSGRPSNEYLANTDSVCSDVHP